MNTGLSNREHNQYTLPSVLSPFLREVVQRCPHPQTRETRRLCERRDRLIESLKGLLW